MEKIVVLGKGGHAKSVVDVLERQGIYKIAGYVVNECNTYGENDYPIIGKDKDLRDIYQEGIKYAAMGIGFLGKSSLRNKLYENLKEIGFFLPVICDPSAIVSNKTIIGEGTFIGKGAIVSVDAEIAKMCIINTGAIIEHDCKVGAFSHISVGSIICGNVGIGANVLVGANSTVIQGRSVGNDCIIGAGEVLKRDLGNNRIYTNNEEAI